MIILPFSPCPERHLDSGRTESLIAAARARLGFGMTPADVHADLVRKGIPADEAHLAIVAANLMEK